MSRVAIVGVGYTDFRSITPEVSWKEIMYKAASRTYQDAGINPRRDVSSYITCAEDYWEGFSIFEEFALDQESAVFQPVITTCDDGIHGLANAFIQIKTRTMDIVAMESHSEIAFHPVCNRPLEGHPFNVAGLEIQKCLQVAGATDTPIWIKGISWASDTCWSEQKDWSKAAYIELTSENTYKIVITGGLFSEGYISANGGFSISVSDRSIICVVLMNTSKLHRALDAMFQLKEQAELRQVGCKTVTSILKKDICN